MEMDAINYIFGTATNMIGTATKYVSVIAGSSVFITSDAPHNYIGAGVCGLFYFTGELLQRKSKNLEDKINGVKK